MATKPSPQLGIMAGVLVISIAVAGFFTGLQAPMKGKLPSTQVKPDLPEPTGEVIAATQYSDISATSFGPNRDWKSSLASLKASLVDPNEVITITPEEKSFALAMREQNRSFNGAPPTIPHLIDQMSSATCALCHLDGIQTASLRISKMSHPNYPNCTQCHVENQPKHMEVIPFGENTFVGLPAPTGGPRAFSGAPPVIPHSVWMRNECNSCHGPSGSHGIRSTHPWRTNCQQCHAPSSSLNQVLIDNEPKFLPPLKIEQ